MKLWKIREGDTFLGRGKCWIFLQSFTFSWNGLKEKNFCWTKWGNNTISIKTSFGTTFGKRQFLNVIESELLLTKEINTHKPCCMFTLGEATSSNSHFIEFCFSNLGDLRREKRLKSWWHTKSRQNRHIIG
mgnify:FL=1